MRPTVTHPRHTIALAIFAAIPAMATPGLGYSQQSLEVLSCPFECKLTVGNEDFWMETSTLAITNNHPPIPDSSDTHSAHVLILNAHGDGVLRSQVNLSGWDTDELHICRMLNRAGVTAPATGSIQIGLTPKSSSLPTVAESGGVEAQVRTLSGRFAVAGDDPFTTSEPTSVTSMPCTHVPSRIADVSWPQIMMSSVGIKSHIPILIQGTKD